MEIKNISTRVSNTRIRFKETNIKVIFGSKILIEETKWTGKKKQDIVWITRYLGTVGCDKIIKSDTVSITDRSICRKNWYYFQNERRRSNCCSCPFVFIMFPIKIIETLLFNFILKLDPIEKDTTLKLLWKVDMENNEIIQTLRFKLN